MREIKFRAKATEDIMTSADGIDVGDWVYGYYYFDRADMTGKIVTTMEGESGGIGSGLVQVHVAVDAETVGIFTGLHDKNGKEIYKGDIVNIEGWGMGDIVFDKGRFGAASDAEHFYWLGFCKVDHSNYECEIIGNRFENPELYQSQD